MLGTKYIQDKIKEENIGDNRMCSIIPISSATRNEVELEDDVICRSFDSIEKKCGIDRFTIASASSLGRRSLMSTLSRSPSSRLTTTNRTLTAMLFVDSPLCSMKASRKSASRLLPDAEPLEPIGRTSAYSRER